MRTTFTHFVGIDPAAESLTAVLEHEGKAISSIEIENSIEGFQRLHQWIAEHAADQSAVLVCVENTGVYSEHLCYWLHARSYAVWLVSARLTSKAATSRDKTDLIDARQIAEYGRRHVDLAKLWQPNAEIIEQLRVLLSAREQLVVQKTANSNMLTAIKRKVVDTPTARRVLEEAIAQLKVHISEIDQQMRQLISSDPGLGSIATLILSIPSVGWLLTANLIVLTNGFRTALNPRQMAAAIGISPHEHSSGTSVYRKPRSVGFGPSRLRKLLYLAAMSARTHNEEFRAYFRRKTAVGKNQRLVLNNIANKLLRLICGVIKSGRPYINDYRSIHPKFSGMTS